MGSLCKQPSHPIWVVASESHYSVLFALSAAVQDTSPLAEVARLVESAVCSVKGPRPIRLPGRSEGSGRSHAPRSAACASWKPAVLASGARRRPPQS